MYIDPNHWLEATVYFNNNTTELAERNPKVEIYGPTHASLALHAMYVHA